MKKPEEEIIDNIKSFYEMFNKTKKERKGFILIPSFNGFDLYEIDKERLELYLKTEYYYNKIKNI